MTNPSIEYNGYIIVFKERDNRWHVMDGNILVITYPASDFHKIKEYIDRKTKKKFDRVPAYYREWGNGWSKVHITSRVGGKVCLISKPGGERRKVPVSQLYAVTKENTSTINLINSKEHDMETLKKVIEELTLSLGPLFGPVEDGQ